MSGYPPPPPHSPHHSGNPQGAPPSLPQPQLPYGGAAYFPPPPSQYGGQQPSQPPSIASPLNSGVFNEAGSRLPGPGGHAGGGAYPPASFPSQPQPYQYAAYVPSHALPPQKAQQDHAHGPAPPSHQPSSSPSGRSSGAHPPSVPGTGGSGAPLREVVADEADQRAARLSQPHPRPAETGIDLLGGHARGPEEEEDVEAHMRAMVDTAVRAKAAGGDGSSPFALPGERSHKGLVFVVGPPRYRVRTALLFAAALFGAIPLMSTFALTVLLCGVILVYIADYLGSIRSTVAALLGTSIGFGGTLLLSNLHAAMTSFGPMLMIIALSGVLMMTTAACLLHFRWLQETKPDLICMLERCVLSVTPVLVLPSLLSTCIALVGSRYGPFAFLFVMCVLHHLFYGPLDSSFLRKEMKKEELKSYMRTTQGAAASSRKRGKPERKAEVRGIVDDLPSGYGDADDEETGATTFVAQQLNDPSHAAIFTVLLLSLPVVVYNFLQTNWEDHVVANLANSFGLLCGSMTYLCVTPSHSLWFLAPPPQLLSKAAGQTDDGNQEKAGGEAEVSPETVALLLAYDPLGLRAIVHVFRTRVLATVGGLSVFWAAYRLTHSRYAYLFDGVPYPLSLVCLIAALALAVYLAIQIFLLVSADEAGADLSRGQHAARRAAIVVASIVMVVLFCVLASVPGMFYFLGVLSVTSLNVFLVQRSNAGPMVSFIVFSALLLLWWMYRCFSFITVDLHVLNGTGTVSSGLVAVSVLWSYILGCLCFLFSFSKSKLLLLLFLFLHSAEVTFVEEVLVAQKEDGAYPAVLVFLTSGLGVLVGYRLYKNEVLGIQGAAFAASCYLSKALTLPVEVTSHYYSGELEQQDPALARALLGGEISFSWWAGLLGCYVATVFEIERHKKLTTREAARLPYLYLLASLVVVLCTVRNVQRAAFEFFTQSYVAADELPHIAPGTACVAFALLTWPFFSRQSQRYPQLRRYATIGKLSAVVGVLLLAVQPTRITESHVAALDYELASADKGRYAAAVGLALLLSSRVVPLQRIPFLLRLFYWLTTAILLAFSITAQLLPVPTLPLFGCMIGLVFLMLLLVDMAHYRNLTSFEGWVVYALSFCVMFGSFVMVGRVDLAKAAGGNAILIWEMHEQGRIQLLSIVAVVNLFVAVLLRFRFAGKPLLPNCVSMTEAIASQVGVMCNYATLFSVITLSVLNFWVNQSEPLLYVFLSLFLLMLVDDNMFFFDLQLRNFRYFPCVAFALSSLWFCLFYHGWSVSVSRGLVFRVLSAVRSAAYGLPLVPAQISLLLDLWNTEEPHHKKPEAKKGAHRSHGAGRMVWATMLLSALVLLFTSSVTLTWIAIVCVCGQCARLFGHTLLHSGTGPHRSTL